jgi:hypothetical protein
MGPYLTRRKAEDVLIGHKNGEAIPVTGRGGT